ncbi:uncharacterized protein LOC111613852 [Centruroides sculpturatus]|uniref:uncharacterized protein LOC111613852 n=1 Tax=Centruroides sculpturatus TaxID=218467 RepID=UPI000C6E60EE|nr:uncharacterized protein LOC111613852 [Centruroides sculpturatus]
MMYFLLAFFILFSLGEGKFCETDVDCEKGECCVLLSGTIIHRGYCHKLTEEGERCSMRDEITHEDHIHHFFKCPCADGLECKAEESQSEESTIFRKPKCAKKSTQ